MAAGIRLGRYSIAEYDDTFPVEKAQDPLFAMLGTAPANKSSAT